MSGESQNKRSSAPRAAALDPRAPLLVQPFKRLVEEGFIIELKVVFTPTGVTAVGRPDPRMIAVKDSGLVTGQDYSLGVLSAIADQGDLIPVKGKKKKNGKDKEQPLPDKSLCVRDFSFKDFSEFQARANAVASKSTGATLVGRVRSAELFGGSSTISFQEWWKTAKPGPRAVALTLKKYRDEFTAEHIEHFKKLQCPFRGPAEFVVSEQTAEAKPGPSKAPASPKQKEAKK